MHRGYLAGGSLAFATGGKTRMLRVGEMKQGGARLELMGLDRRQAGLMRSKTVQRGEIFLASFLPCHVVGVGLCCFLWLTLLYRRCLTFNATRVLIMVDAIP